MTRSLAGSRCVAAMALPDWVKPQLTKLFDQRPDGPEWLHESKFDGYLVFSDDVKGLTCCLLPFCYKTVGNASAPKSPAPNSTESAGAARAVDVYSFDASTDASDCR
jgi:hypothetical protein